MRNWGIHSAAIRSSFCNRSWRKGGLACCNDNMDVINAVNILFSHGSILNPKYFLQGFQLAIHKQIYGWHQLPTRVTWLSSSVAWWALPSRSILSLPSKLACAWSVATPTLILLINQRDRNLLEVTQNHLAVNRAKSRLLHLLEARPNFTLPALEVAFLHASDHGVAPAQSSK